MWKTTLKFRPHNLLFVTGLCLWSCSPTPSDTVVPKLSGSVTSPGPTSTSNTGPVDRGHTAVWPACSATAATSCVDGTWSVYPLPMQPNVLVESDHVVLRSPNAFITTDQAQTIVQMTESILTSLIADIPTIEPYCQNTNKYKLTILIGVNSSTYIYAQGAVWVIATSPPPPTQAVLTSVVIQWLIATEGGATGTLINSVDSADYFLNRVQGGVQMYNSCAEEFYDFPHMLPGWRSLFCDGAFMDYVADTLCPDALWSILLHPPLSDPNADFYENMTAAQQWSPDQLNDFMGEWMRHNVAWDYRDPNGGDQSVAYLQFFGPMSDTSNLPSEPNNGPINWRQTRTTMLDILDASHSRYNVPAQRAPQRFGYNAVQLFPKQSGNSNVTVTFRGVVQLAPANTPPTDPNLPPFSIALPNSDWRWGLVAVNNNQSRYSDLQHGSDGAVTFAVQSNDQLWLMVMATPAKYQRISVSQPYYSLYRYPWMVEIDNAWPQGYQANRALPAGQAWANGGGWVADKATVASGVYVGPNAQVLGGVIGGNARIDDQAIVLDANVSGNAWIKGVSVLANGITVTDNAVVDTTYKPIGGGIAVGQSVAGTVQLLGDAYLLDALFTQGAVYGYQLEYPAVIPEVTAAPQYTWRP